MVFDKTPSPASLADISLHLIDQNKKRCEIAQLTTMLDLDILRLLLCIIVIKMYFQHDID